MSPASPVSSTSRAMTRLFTSSAGSPCLVSLGSEIVPEDAGRRLLELTFADCGGHEHAIAPDDGRRPRAAGRSTAHATFFFVDHSVGSVDASATPELAPRNWGQSVGPAAEAWAAMTRTVANALVSMCA
jgi:hypothetical protein